ncbi:MAG: arsenate reductase (glutaredoxin) [Flavobacteriaceae bacterium]|nr:arsenate reductase (glutaredoxin) [Flavobacteriaceae bacterium]|tara:strand:- start:59 stop:400 length:342 start_codon:yes stop_codon:yes gene_type:complete
MKIIYHNPRCRKSRETLQILKDKNVKFKITEYLKNNLSKTQLENLITKLDIEPISLVRINEQLWKDNFKNKDLTDNEIIQILSDNPKLIERPIVESNNKAIIGRPPENVLKII